MVFDDGEEEEDLLGEQEQEYIYGEEEEEGEALEGAEEGDEGEEGVEGEAAEKLDEEKPPKEGAAEAEGVEAEEREEETLPEKHVEKKAAPVKSKKKTKAAKKAPIKKKIEPTSEERIRMAAVRVSGDFAALDTDILLDTHSISSIASYLSVSKESTVEEEEVEEEEREPIDRVYYYDLYKKLQAERSSRKIKNNLLHRKMAEYFRKRRMEHVLKETHQQMDSQTKYDKRLNELDDLKTMDKRERDSITADLDDMRNQRNSFLSRVNSHFNQMQQREKDIGSAVVNTKTGKQLPDKTLERLIKRQRDKWDEVAALRLSYIKIRNKVAEKKDALRALDYVGENLHLIDYEQLKIENQSHLDKIEERDEELTKLRAKCCETIQCLAHFREKSSACLLDYENYKERLEQVEDDLNDSREGLNEIKQQRDLCRSTTRNLIEESGLLTQPKLLLNMEDSLNEIEKQTQRLGELKKENQAMQQNLTAIKANIAKTVPIVQKEVVRKVIEKKPPSRLYKGRPTLLYPDLFPD